MGNKILFRINWWRVNYGFNIAPDEEVHWREFRWMGRLSHWPAPVNPAIVVSGGEVLILRMILFPLSLRQQQPSGSNLAFLSAHVILCCVAVGCVSRSVPVRLNICSKLVRYTNYLSEYFSGFAWFSTSVRPNLTVSSAARTHLRHTVARQ
jgi:hypothetical protein